MLELLVIMHAGLKISLLKVKVHEVAHEDVDEEQRREVFVSSHIESFEGILCLLYLLLRGSSWEL